MYICIYIHTHVYISEVYIYIYIYMYTLYVCMYIGDAACEEALPYILEADAAKARAAESEAALAREVYNARKAESRAEDARNAAIKVGGWVGGWVDVVCVCVCVCVCV